MTLNIQAIDKIKSVYTDDFQTIYISTNRDQVDQASPESETLNKYLYCNGQFFNISGASPQLCNRNQHSFLMNLMTNLGSF